MYTTYLKHAQLNFFKKRSTFLYFCMNGVLDTSPKTGRRGWGYRAHFNVCSERQSLGCWVKVCSNGQYRCRSWQMTWEPWWRIMPHEKLTKYIEYNWMNNPRIYLLTCHYVVVLVYDFVSACLFQFEFCQTWSLNEESSMFASLYTRLKVPRLSYRRLN